MFEYIIAYTSQEIAHTSQEIAYISEDHRIYITRFSNKATFYTQYKIKKSNWHLIHFAKINLTDFLHKKFLVKLCKGSVPL